MSKTKKGSNATFTGTGKAFSFIDDRLFAYSGAVAIDNNETAVIESQTGKGYTVAQFTPVYFDTSSSDDVVYKVYFNNLQVYGTVVNGATSETPFQTTPLLIPPLTLVKVEAYNRTDTSTLNLGAIITGRVYYG